MDVFINILANYWKVILSVILFILAFILLCIKKRPVEVIETVRQKILDVIPAAIRSAESIYGAGNGQEKLNYACQLIYDLIASYTGLQRRKVPDMFEDFVKACIEDVLATPQKKGGEADGK